MTLLSSVRASIRRGTTFSLLLLVFVKGWSFFCDGVLRMLLLSQLTTSSATNFVFWSVCAWGFICDCCFVWICQNKRCEQTLGVVWFYDVWLTSWPPNPPPDVQLYQLYSTRLILTRLRPTRHDSTQPDLTWLDLTWPDLTCLHFT